MPSATRAGFESKKETLDGSYRRLRCNKLLASTGGAKMGGLPTLQSGLDRSAISPYEIEEDPFTDARTECG